MSPGGYAKKREGVPHLRELTTRVYPGEVRASKKVKFQKIKEPDKFSWFFLSGGEGPMGPVQNKKIKKEKNAGKF